jgi:hypothetical protein
MLWTGLVWRRIGTGGEFCELGNEPSGSINAGNYRMAAQLVASRVVFGPTELVSKLGAGINNERTKVQRLPQGKLHDLTFI